MTQFLVVLAAIAGYLIFCLFKQGKPCRRCRGWGHRQRRRRRTACPKCKGTGVRMRLGARLVSTGVAAAIRHHRERAERLP